jgi:hypothetical protein
MILNDPVFITAGSACSCCRGNIVLPHPQLVLYAPLNSPAEKYLCDTKNQNNESNKNHLLDQHHPHLFI